MLMWKERFSKTIAAGSATGATQSYSGAFIEHVLVNPNTSTTTYDFKLTNDDGDIIYQRLSHVGKINEINTRIPVIGIVTWTISNATANETVTVLLAPTNG